MLYGKVVHEGHFDAAHKLPDGFGKCSIMHGHTYNVRITVEGYVGTDGVIADFRALKESYSQLDHIVLNERICVPTAENIAEYILLRVEHLIDDVEATVTVRLWEGNSNHVEFTREGGE